MRLTTRLASLALITASAHAQLQTARLVKDANRAPGSFNSAINWVMPIGNNVVFPRDTLAHGSELWISDGTAKGTRLLKDITPGPGGTYPEDPQPFGSLWASSSPSIAFRNSSATEVWITEGVADGTRKIFTSPAPGGEVRIQAGTLHGVFFEAIDHDSEDPTDLYFGTGFELDTRSLNPLGPEGRRFSNPYGYIIRGPDCLFMANGNEIWTTDGYNVSKRVTVTEGIPQQIAFANAGLFIDVGYTYRASELWLSTGQDQISRIDWPEDMGSALTEQMIEFRGDLALVRYDDLFNRELWMSNGTTAGTRRIALQHLGQGAESHVLGKVTKWQDALYVPAIADNGNHELWRTDGTPAGTRRIASFTPPKTSLEFYETPGTSDFLYFQTADANGYHQLWRTKGDAASTRPVRGTPNIASLSEWPQFAVTDTDQLFFAADPLKPTNALWRLRGKTNGAIQVTKPEKATATGTVDSPVKTQSYEIYNGMLLTFVDTGSGKELWSMKPDGSGARSVWKPSVPLTDIYSTLGFHAITSHGLIFSLYDGAEVRQVWVTDGTRKGTRLLGDHGAANNGGYPYDFVKLGDTWYYSVVNYDFPTGASLWKTDGTPAGTTKIVAADGTAPGPLADELVVFNNLLYFFVADTDGITSLWRSDGTAAGTVLLKDEWFGSELEIPHSLSVVAGELVFAVRQDGADTLWHSDGTAAGTLRVDYPYVPYGDFFSGSISPAVDLNGVAIFQGARFWSSKSHWWRYDSTGDSPSLTPLRADQNEQQMYPWYPGSRMQAVAGTRMFYQGIEQSDSELWITDGTDAGTQLVKDINPGPNSSNPSDMLAVGNVIYFTAYDEAHGTELWRSDGTEAGTVLIADIEPGPNASFPRGLKVMNGKLWFTAQRRDIGRELFSIDLPQ